MDFIRLSCDGLLLVRYFLSGRISLLPFGFFCTVPPPVHFVSGPPCAVAVRNLCISFREIIIFPSGFVRCAMCHVLYWRSIILFPLRRSVSLPQVVPGISCRYY